MKEAGAIKSLVDEFSNFARMPAQVFADEAASDLVRQAVYLQQGELVGLFEQARLREVGDIRSVATFNRSGDDGLEFLRAGHLEAHVVAERAEDGAGAPGACVDAVSRGEIERALRAGFDGAGEPAGIVYTADVVDDATLDRLIELDIPMNAGSTDMLEQLGRRPDARRAVAAGRVLESVIRTARFRSR